MAINIIMLNQIIYGDCFEVLKDIPDNSINLICTDPPYFKVKKDNWDRQWDKPEHFLEWIDKAAEHWQRVLKPNGSIYCFASPKMAARVEVKLGERFNIVNRITWQKPPFSTKAEMFVKEDLRGFFSASESIIFCEHYGADNIAKGEVGYGAKCDELRGFVFEPLRQYIVEEFNKSGLDKIQFNVICGFSATSGGMASRHYLSSSQWCLPTKEHYASLNKATNCFTRPYEELRQQYEELRRPFSVTADVPYTDVWTFPTVSAYKGKHPCEKPLELIKHIIKSSSREGDLVLDPFCGSGTTALACKELGRNYICIEKEKEYFDIACDRISQPREYSETELEIMELKQPEFKQLSLFDVA
jgi:site-specific DNA-methyltransferase (adenine-specific)